MAEGKPKGKRYAMVIDLRRCVGCFSCQVTCKMENNVPFDYFRSKVLVTERGTYPDVKRHFLPTLCNHCENAPCVQVCPVGASYRREDGLILVDDKKCIGCGYCVQACPYDARYINATGVAEKCTFCQHRVDAGLEPACVHNCVGKARLFGDLNDPQSPVSKLVNSHSVQRLKSNLGTEPYVFYLDADLITLERRERK